MEILFKLLLTLNSLSLSLIVFLIKEEIVVKSLQPYLSEFTPLVSFVLYFFIILICTFFILKLGNYLGLDSVDKGSISVVEPANDSFLPSYLGYFFVALSVPTFEVFIFVFGIIFVFVYYSRISYFNPILFIFGYNFYYIVHQNNIKVLLITKKQIKNPNILSFNNLRRINNYTFFDAERN